MKVQLLKCLALLALAVAVQAGTVCSFSFTGPGPSGSDPCSGQDWTTQLTGDQVPRTSWGIPGLLQGTRSWAGAEPITDFHIQFYNLPAGVVIAELPVPTGPFGSDDSTRFSNVSDGVLWNRSISGTEVHFWSTNPSGWLDLGDSFFVNVVFTGYFNPSDSRWGFNASYTNDAVPEPGTWGLMATGLAGVIALARRRR